MFNRSTSPAKKKFATPVKVKRRRPPLDPRTRALIRQGLIGTAVLSVLGLCLTGLWYGTRVTPLTLTTVVVSGGETVSHAAVEAEVQRVLEGNYFGIVPRRFAWWYPTTEVTAAVGSMPRIKDPQVTRIDGTTLAVSFTEYVPYALWCQDRNHDQCLFIDETGFAFTPAPKLTGGAFPRYHVVGTAPALKTAMIPAADLAAIEELRARVSEELKLPIAFVETDMMRDVFMGVAGGGEIKASLRMPVAETYSNLESILSSPQFATIAPGNFQYIDLRFGSKVFVNNSHEVATSSLATSTLDAAVAALEEATTVSAATTTNARVAEETATTSVDE